MWLALDAALAPVEPGAAPVRLGPTRPTLPAAAPTPRPDCHGMSRAGARLAGRSSRSVVATPDTFARDARSDPHGAVGRGAWSRLPEALARDARSDPRYGARGAREIPNARKGQIPRAVRACPRAVISDGAPLGRAAERSVIAEISFGLIRWHIAPQVSAKSRATEGKSRTRFACPSLPPIEHAKSRSYKIVEEIGPAKVIQGLLVNSRDIGGPEKRCRSLRSI